MFFCLTMNNSKTTLFQFSAGAVALISILVFYYTYFQYSINIPWFDDIENIPYFLVNWIQSSTFSEKWNALFLPNNEHRVLFARSVVLLQYYLTNEINFQILGFIGNLSIAVIFFLLSSNYLRQSGKWFHLIPVVFLVFNLQSYSGIYMTIMSLQYQVVIMLSMLVFYLLCKPSNKIFALALLIAFIDTFSMGNGMLVWPAGLLLLLFLSEWKKSFIWSLSGVIAIFLYFYGFDFIQGNDRAVDYLMKFPVRTFISFFTMIGGDFDVMPEYDFNRRIIIPTVAGVIIFTMMAFWLIKVLSNSRFWSRFLPKSLQNNDSSWPFTNKDNLRFNAFWLATAAYVTGGILLVVLLRTRFDYQLVLWSTYKMYPAVLTSVAYLVILQNLKNKYHLVAMVIASIVTFIACVSGYYNYLPKVIDTQQVRTAFAYNQRYNGIGLGAQKDSPFEMMIHRTLTKADSIGFYSLPQPLIHPDESKLDLNSTTKEIEVQVSETENSALRIQTSVDFDDHKKAFVVLQSDANTYLFAVSRYNGEADCPLATIRSGIYKIGIWEVDQFNSLLSVSDQTFTVK